MKFLSNFQAKYSMALSDKVESALIKSQHRVIDGLTEYASQETTLARVIASAASLVGRHAIFAKACGSRDPQAAAAALLGPVAALEPSAAHILLQRHEAALSKQVGNLDLVLEALRSVQARTILLLRDLEDRTAAAAASTTDARREPVPLRAGAGSALRPLTLAFLHGCARRARLALVADLLHKAAVVARLKMLMAAYLTRDDAAAVARQLLSRPAEPTASSAPLRARSAAVSLSAAALLPELERSLAQACTLAAACGAGALDSIGVDADQAEEHVYGLARAAATAAADAFTSASDGRARVASAEGAARSATAAGGTGAALAGAAGTSPSGAIVRQPRRPAPVTVTVEERSDHAVLTFVSPRSHSRDAGDATSMTAADGSGSARRSDDAEAAALQAALAGAAGVTLSHVLACWGQVVDDAWLFAQRRIVEVDDGDDADGAGTGDAATDAGTTAGASTGDAASVAGGAGAGASAKGSPMGEARPVSAAGTPRRPGTPL